MADAEAERTRMTASIEKLEMEKQELEASNALKIEENRYLLDQLEAANDNVNECDNQIKSLEAALRSTQQEIHRLNVLALRAESLENQLIQLESEQAALQQSLEHSQEDERSAIQRWRHAERTIASLQDQMERIEREARADRERHVEVIDRIEKRKAVEIELHAAAGRLKGAAASKTADGSKGGGTVVSHFVRDILQDNANLQQAVVELRELLLGSNDEVEKLRQQLMIHQPVEGGVSGTERPNLLTELEKEAQQRAEVHVHHHYHAPPPPELKPKAVIQHRRSKKRRSIVIASASNPPSVYHSARSSVSSIKAEPLTSSSTATILANTAVSIPRHRPQWSVQSGVSVATSSLPNSPAYSDYRRTSSIFDRVFSDAGMESSRPTSPESACMDSPMFTPSQRTSLPPMLMKGISSPGILDLRSPGLGSSVSGTMSGSFPVNEQSESEPDLTTVSTLTSPSAIPEEPEDSDILSSPSVASGLDSPDFFPASFTDRRLRRASSHDSLLSISGMDIHTLKARPSQLLRVESTSSPVLGATQTVAKAARPSPIRPIGSDSVKTLRSSLLIGNAADQRALGGKSRWGWGWNLWGSSDTTTPAVVTAADGQNITRQAAEVAISPSAGILQTSKLVPPTMKLRTPGINQPGPIFGMGPEPATPFKTMVATIDTDALHEGLMENN